MTQQALGPQVVPPAWALAGVSAGAPAAARGDMPNYFFLSYDLLIEGLARQWVACSEGHSPESRRTCRVDT
jgi:hypothetical protein